MSNDQKRPRQPLKRAETARFVVSVDHQPKRSFDTREAADEEARRILEAFPILTVDVHDAEENTTGMGTTATDDEGAAT